MCLFVCLFCGLESNLTSDATQDAVTAISRCLVISEAHHCQVSDNVKHAKIDVLFPKTISRDDNASTGTTQRGDRAVAMGRIETN